jgi:putative phosphoribosyl transferase
MRAAMTNRMICRDRTEAGRLLGERLRDKDLNHAVVLGLPRGGVAVAAVVAEMLDAPLDIVVARKLGVPWQPELAFGAVAPGVVVLREDVVRAAGIDRATIVATTDRETARLEELAERYRAGMPAVPLAGATAIIVDDGLATGATATAAARAVRRAGPTRMIVAVPVCSADTAEELRREVDEVFCLGEDRDFRAVGHYYSDFGDVSDSEVRDLLRRRDRAPADR